CILHALGHALLLDPRLHRIGFVLRAYRSAFAFSHQSVSVCTFSSAAPARSSSPAACSGSDWFGKLVSDCSPIAAEVVSGVGSTPSAVEALPAPAISGAGSA